MMVMMPTVQLRTYVRMYIRKCARTHAARAPTVMMIIFTYVSLDSILFRNMRFRQHSFRNSNYVRTYSNTGGLQQALLSPQAARSHSGGSPRFATYVRTYVRTWNIHNKLTKHGRRRRRRRRRRREAVCCANTISHVSIWSRCYATNLPCRTQGVEAPA